MLNLSLILRSQNNVNNSSNSYHNIGMYDQNKALHINKAKNINKLNDSINVYIRNILNNEFSWVFVYARNETVICGCCM